MEQIAIKAMAHLVRRKFVDLPTEDGDKIQFANGKNLPGRLLLQVLIDHGTYRVGLCHDNPPKYPQCIAMCPSDKNSHAVPVKKITFIKNTVKIGITPIVGITIKIKPCYTLKEGIRTVVSFVSLTVRKFIPVNSPSSWDQVDG